MHSGETSDRSKKLMTLEFFTLKFDLAVVTNIIIRVRENSKTFAFVFMTNLASQLASSKLFFSFLALFFVDKPLFIFMLFNCDKCASHTINCLIVDWLNHIKIPAYYYVEYFCCYIVTESTHHPILKVELRLLLLLLLLLLKQNIELSLNLLIRISCTMTRR